MADRVDPLDAPEPEETLEDIASSSWTPNRYTVSLRDGIDLNEIKEAGTCFEIDPDRNVPPGDEDSQYFDSEQVFQELNYECNDIGDDSNSDVDENESPFTHIARSMTDVSGDGGVLKKVLRPGTGPVVPAGATVRVHYNGYVEYSDEPFDSTRLRNKPEVFRLGECLPGMTIGVSSMKKGEKARFLIAPKYYYKEMGCPPRVPPNAQVFLEAELLSFIDHQAADEFHNFTKEERKQASFEQLLKVANAEREAGNDLCQRKQFQRAINKYIRAIRLLEECRLQNEEEEKMSNQLLLVLDLNSSHCALQLKQQARAIKYAKKVLELDPKNVKAFYRMGKAYMIEGDFERARSWFLKARKRDPNNGAIKDALLLLDTKVDQFKTIEKQMCTRMFAQLGIENQKDKPSGETTPLDISEENKRIMKERLREFKEDTALRELPFPSTLTQREVACIKETAQKLGLSVDVAKSGGGNRGLVVVKEEVKEGEKENTEVKPVN